MAAQSSMAQIEAPSVAQAALLVGSRIAGRTGSSAFGTLKTVVSTSRNIQDMAQTRVVSTAELQLHPDSVADLRNSISSMTAIGLAQRQSEDPDAQDATRASDAVDSGHANLVGGGSVGTGAQEAPVAVRLATRDLSSAMLQRVHTGARLLQFAKLYILTVFQCIFACK